jgi:catechol 2,3-dioxygenase-like lactoylglutathione lyase family enzyme
VQIDHVMYAVRELSDASAWFADAFGLRAVAGGAHPQWGTANAIIPVGNGQYIELITVSDHASTHPLARFLSGLVSDGDRPVAICLRPDDLDATARRLDLDISDGERVKPDGQVLRWRLAGVAHALGSDRLPIFIEWPGGGANPELDGTVSAGAGVAWAEFGGDADTLGRWMGGAQSVISVVPGGPGVRRFAIRHANETVVIGGR